MTVVSARAGALQPTTALAAFLHNSRLMRECLSWVMRVDLAVPGPCRHEDERQVRSKSQKPAPQFGDELECLLKCSA